jgi:hypothetical protein
MKVSVDGLRRNMARAYNKAIDGYQYAIECHDGDDFETLKEGLDELRQMIGGLMCVYSDDPEDLMTNMADEADKLFYADPEDADEV